MRKGDEEECISWAATDGDRRKVQAQQTVFTRGEAMGGSGTRDPSNISSLVEAKHPPADCACKPAAPNSVSGISNWRGGQLLLSPLLSPQSSDALVR